MTDHLTEDELLLAIPGLTRTRLVAFIETEMILPLRAEQAGGATHRFRQVDCARLRLLCELTDDLDLPVDALEVVISLIDQLHATRKDLITLTRAIESETPDIRGRIGVAVRNVQQQDEA
ncbi:MAG: hypothetical protein ACK4GC_13430 [Paracoccaceae bacterium]